MTSVTDAFSRQSELFEPSEYGHVRVHVFGLGTIGSFTAFCLAKMGIRLLELYDFDTVELHNVANQFYGVADVGRLKTAALSDRIAEAAPDAGEVVVHSCVVTDATALDIRRHDYVILAVDNFEGRSIIFDKARTVPGVNIIDGRMSGEFFRVFSFNTLDRERMDKFADSLNPAATIDDPCGQRSISYNAFAVASVIAAQVKKMAKSEPYPFEVDLSLRNYSSVVED
jgi:molybdopterin/thiamine biosynthesis adenylyltransferase